MVKWEQQLYTITFMLVTAKASPATELDERVLHRASFVPERHGRGPFVTRFLRLQATSLRRRAMQVHGKKALALSRSAGAVGES